MVNTLVYLVVGKAKKIYLFLFLKWKFLFQTKVGKTFKEYLYKFQRNSKRQNVAKKITCAKTYQNSLVAHFYCIQNNSFCAKKFKIWGKKLSQKQKIPVCEELDDDGYRYLAVRLSTLSLMLDSLMFSSTDCWLWYSLKERQTITGQVAQISTSVVYMVGGFPAPKLYTLFVPNSSHLCMIMC